MTPLNKIISVRRRFLRSVNIARDQKRAKGLEGYIITPLVLQTLAQISDSFTQNITDRAFTLTGPYGTGKSSFGLLLYHLLQDQGGYAWDQLKAADKEFAKNLWNTVYGTDGSKCGFLVLPVTARRASVATLLAETFDELEIPLRDQIASQVEALRVCKDSKTAIRLVEEIAELAVKDDYKGLFFIFDEFGKVFEEAYFNKKETDINLLQDLSEAASRSEKNPILFLGMLHQSFGNYVDDIHDVKTKNEFNKIQGRFTPMSFIETPAAQLQLLAGAIERNEKLRPGYCKNDFDDLIGKGLSLTLHSISGLSLEEFRNYVSAAWPIHPLALLALPLLFRRFGQNERSIFTFLASNEPHSFQSFINSSTSDSLLGLDWLFDYLITNYETQLSHHPQGKIFLEANDILNSKNLSEQEQTVVKVVAVLSSLGKQSNLKASTALIEYAMGKAGCNLQKLQTQSILVYRKFSDSFCVWEGSDVDLIECAEKADKALGRSGFALAQPLREALPPRPIIAKRHSFRTGSLRYFAVDYVDSPDDLIQVLNDKKGIGDASGRVLICFAGSDATMETFIEEGKKLSADDLSVLFAVPKNIDELRAALYEVQRLKWIVDNTEELRDDRIAQREIDLRQAEAKQKVAQLRISLTDPRPAPLGSNCKWVWNGEQQEMHTGKDVSILLSKVCDALYPDSPCVLNEMINKRAISGQAAAARNNLIKYLNRPEAVAQQFLGITGFPPDRSIYEGLLYQSGIHRKIDGVWQLSAPEKDNSTHLYSCWKKIEDVVFSAETPILLKDLYAQLSAPPYGMLDGIMPIVLTAFYVLNRKEVTLYQEGSFLPDPQDAHFELLVRRPDLFAIAGAKILGMRKKIVERLAGGLNTDQAVSDIVRYLYKMLGSLSKYAKTTNAVSEQTRDFRQAFDDAKSPEKLLFVDLPKVFGLSPITEDAGNDADFEQYFKQLNHCLGELSALLPNLLKTQRAILLEACKLPDSQDGWNTLYERACFLAPKVTNTELIPFLQNVANTMGDWNKADAVMGYMVSVPLKNWTALDIKNFPGIAAGKAQLFTEAYRPYAKSTGALTKAEQKQAEQLKSVLKKQFPEGQNCAVTRAALLACIEELDREDEK